MNNTLKMGSHGAEVKQLQRLLNGKLKLSPALLEDGVFGKATDLAVKQFQAQQHLGLDGIVGPKTWAALLTEAPVVVVKPVVTVPASAPWMEIARAEISQAEIAGSRHNPRIIAYHATTSLKASTDETPWCSSFVNWVLLQAGKKGTNSAAAISWLSWGESCGAQGGAITVIHNSRVAGSSFSASGNHVGFLVQETATHYLLLGGNQGDKVQVTFFPKTSWSLRGYRWPE